MPIGENLTVGVFHSGCYTIRYYKIVCGIIPIGREKPFKFRLNILNIGIINKNHLNGNQTNFDRTSFRRDRTVQ